MTLPVRYANLDEITLDDLKFQDLVDEGRKRIRQYCPDWTEYNLSDPGVTLLELFAWMTELTVYRLNQVPYKNYIKFLEMLGYGLLPAKPATTELTFRLAAPFPVDPNNRTEDLHAKIERGLEVSTGGASGEPIVFTTDRELFIRTPKIMELRTPKEFAINYWQTLSTGKLQKEFTAFTSGEPPLGGDAFYIGFTEPVPLLGEAERKEPYSRLAGHILCLTIHCKIEEPPPPSAEGDEASTRPTAGHNPQKPPLTWEYLTVDTTVAQFVTVDSQAASPTNLAAEKMTAWKECPIGSDGADGDTTGGLYNATGTITLFLPLDIQVRHLNRIPAIWVRCRYVPGKHNDSENKYSVSPVIKRLHVQTVGATVTATNSRQMGQQLLGISNGEPGQTFALKHKPILSPLPATTDPEQAKPALPGERVLVESNDYRRESRQTPYDYCPTFAFSDKHAKHVLLNPNTGEVHFGPSIRQQDGSLRQYGCVPPIGSRIYLEGYRYHAGSQGNVPVGFLRVMHKSIPYVDSVTNRKPVEDGRDQETVEEAIMRAQRSMRAQQRAVSATDFEEITREKYRTSNLARVKCLTPDDFTTPLGKLQPVVAAGTVDLLVVPTIKNPGDPTQWSSLEPSRAFCEAVQQHLQPYCLLARSVQVRRPAYCAIKVTLAIVPYWPEDLGKDAALREQVLRFLYRYFSPLSYGRTQDELIADLPAVVRSPRWQGWNFGELPQESILYSLLREIDGIKYIGDFTILAANLTTLEEKEIQNNLANLAKIDSITSRPDLLLCSYQHEVKIERVK